MLMLCQNLREPPNFVKGVVEWCGRDADHVRFAEIAFYAGGFEFAERLFRMFVNQDRADSFSAHPKNADEKAGEYGLKPEGDERRSRYDESHCVGVIQMAETGQPPLPDGSQQQTATHEHR